MEALDKLALDVLLARRREAHRLNSLVKKGTIGYESGDDIAARRRARGMLARSAFKVRVLVLACAFVEGKPRSLAENSLSSSGRRLVNALLTELTDVGLEVAWSDVFEWVYAKGKPYPYDELGHSRETDHSMRDVVYACWKAGISFPGRSRSDLIKARAELREIRSEVSGLKADKERLRLERQNKNSYRGRG